MQTTAIHRIRMVALFAIAAALVEGPGGVSAYQSPAAELGKRSGARDIALLSDGRIVVGGYSGNPGFRYQRQSRIALATYSRLGALDSRFGGNGIVVARPGSPDLAFATKGNQIVAAQGWLGYPDISQSGVAVLRLDADGHRDERFGDRGRATIDVPQQFVNDVAIQPDGKVLVAARMNTDRTSSPVVLRLTHRGHLDPTFGSGGVVPVPPGADALTVQADGKIVVAGTDFATTRLNADGTIDTGFGGGDGVATAPLLPNSFNVAHAVVTKRDGHVIVAGGTFYNCDPYQGCGSEAGVLVRYTSHGEFDTSFARDGVFRDGSSATFYDLAVAPNGQLVAVDGRVHRFSRDGFGIATSQESPYSAGTVAVESNGRVVTAGGIEGVEAPSFAVRGFRPMLEVDRLFGGGDGLALTPEAAKCRGRIATIKGTARPDRIIGTPAADVVVAVSGDDRIRSFGGDDLVCAGFGDDLVHAGRGSDHVYGGFGNDVIYGGPGRDYLAGGPGVDLFVPQQR